LTAPPGHELDAAIRLRERGEPAEALALLRDLVRGSPSPRTWYELGRAFRELGYNGAAEACFARALGDRPELWEPEGMYDPSEPLTIGVEDAEAWVALSRLLLSRGETEAALAAADRAVFLGHGEGWEPKALALQAAGRTREALRALGEARARGVARGALEALEARLRRGGGDREGSRKAARRALHWDPGRRTARRAE
jgi:tetratricopeptide (TPR) repeat protein